MVETLRDVRCLKAHALDLAVQLDEVLEDLAHVVNFRLA
jgi:hypothetical protein